MVFNLRTFSFTESDEGDPTRPKNFSLKELRVATHNFNKDNFLVEGEICKVYRGRLADSSLVAVKRVCCVDRWREEQFKAEIQVGSTVSMHPNVLRLRGYCRTKRELLLVYPLMINNSLSYNLRERPDRLAKPIDWTTRKQIALGAARGLAHLHNHGNVKIMHRGICASNILLNVHFEAVVGGFSFATIMHERNAEEGTIEWRTRMPSGGKGVSFSSPAGKNTADSGSGSQSFHHYKDVYVYAPIRGRVGFIAPEYLRTGKCTLKNDVFAYGNMLLELILGQQIYKFLAELHNGKAFCPDDWVRNLIIEKQLGRVIDPKLQGNYLEDEAEQLVRLALLCTHEDPSVRPEMSEVVRILESEFLQRDPSTKSSWSRSECDSTPCYSFPPPLGIAP
ncbi:hypothetical protein BT93_K1076 [Corymbia citriodora subsp. variegata]|nr:hypothetical protein BT93_K1076 [Corymbia citriodora subsp. variegata]